MLIKSLCNPKTGKTLTGIFVFAEWFAGSGGRTQPYCVSANAPGGQPLHSAQHQREY
jgi:hypothetical protein